MGRRVTGYGWVQVQSRLWRVTTQMEATGGYVKGDIVHVGVSHGMVEVRLLCYFR